MPKVDLEETACFQRLGLVDSAQDGLARILLSGERVEDSGVTTTMVNRLLSVGTMLVLLAAAPVSAATITFDNSGSFTGTFSYDDSTGIATASGIGFDIITVVGAPAGDAAYACVGCSLSLTTSAATFETITGGTGIALFTGGGGSITLTGQVFDLSANLVSSTNTVLSGSFSTSPINQLVLANSQFGGVDGDLGLVGGDNKDEGFVAELGLDNPFGFLGSAFSLGGCTTSGSVTTCNVTEADLANNNINPPGDVVPEPGSMFLLGSGLLGLAASARRRLKR